MTGVTLERTAPIPIRGVEESLPPRHLVAETEVMASSTAIPWAAVSTPDTG